MSSEAQEDTTSPEIPPNGSGDKKEDKATEGEPEETTSPNAEASAGAVDTAAAATTSEEEAPAAAAAANTTTASKTVTPPVIPADWAQLGCSNNDAPVIRYPTDVAGSDVWDATETDTIMLVGTSGQKMTHLGSDFSTTMLHPQLQRLILRSHVLASMDGLGSLQAVQLLELYDNQIEELKGLDDNAPFHATLRTLDMSYNVIRDMAPVQFCPNLQELCEF